MDQGPPRIDITRGCRRCAMAAQVLNLPVNVPWTLIGVSPDMMDVQFCDKRFPVEWRSSLAVSVFEPKAEDLPPDLCAGVVTFLKVTCTITGYQPTRTETERGYGTLTDLPRPRLDEILRQYFACYGALLTVAVFPYPRTRSQVTPVIVDFGQANLGDQEPNPYQVGDVSFRTLDESHSAIVDLTLPDGSSRRVLDLRKQARISCPATPRVVARLVHRAGVVTMDAFHGGQLVGSATSGPASEQLEELSVEGDGIDLVAVSSPNDDAFLVEFGYETTGEVPVGLDGFPHVIDFEPKTRDLYQGATEDGEVLTASSSEVRTDKTHTRTDSSETGLSVFGSIGRGLATAAGTAGGAVAGGPVGAAAGASLASGLSAGLSHQWGDTNQDTTQVQTDASRDRRERYATSTNITQMYNVLTGYHLGTNRAVFLMLPRPHVLQPTDFRTFVQGLRYIEGVQEFFLVVARPPDIAGLCVEASLETGHFPEDVTPPLPDERFKPGAEEFVVTAESKEDGARSIQEFDSSKYTVRDGTVIDRSAGDPFHNGIQFLGGQDEEGAFDQNTIGSRITIFNYQPATDAAVQVMGQVLRLPGDNVRHVALQFRVFTHSQQPLPNTGQPGVGVGRLVITHRDLCVCYRSGDCPAVVEPPVTTPAPGSVVDERTIELNPALLTLTASQASRQPAMKELMQKIQSAMTTSGRLPSRRPVGAVGFLETDFFTDRVKPLLPPAALAMPLGTVAGLPPAVVRAFGSHATVADALAPDLAGFAARTGLDVADAGKARFTLLTARPVGPG
jgi:hypothetical protein